MLLFGIWGFTTLLLLLLIGAAFYYFFVMIPPAVLRAGRALGRSYKEVWKLHTLNIPIVDFANNLEKAQRANIDIDFDELMEFFQFHGDRTNGYIDHLIGFKATGIKLPRDIITQHFLANGNIEKLKELRFVVEKADLELDWPGLLMSGIKADDLRSFIDALIRAQKANLFLPKSKLAALDPDSRSQLEENYITQNNLLAHYRAKINVEKYVDAMIMARRVGLDISKEALDLHYLTDGDMMKLVVNMIKVKKAELDIDQVTLMQQRLVGGDMESLVDALIKAKTARLYNLSIDDLIDYHLLGGNVQDFVAALDVVENNRLNISKEELAKHTLSRGNIVSYTNAMALVKKHELNISKEVIETASINGFDVADILSTVIASRGQSYEIDFNLAMKASKRGVKPSEVIDWAIRPKVFKVEPRATMVAQNGIEIIPYLTVTLSGRISHYFSTSREQVIFERVNEALITEVETFGTHEEILQNLEWISKRVLYQLQGRMEMPRNRYKTQKQIEDDMKANNEKEQRLNAESAYEIIDISIYDIEIGKDIFRDLRERETEFARNQARKEADKRISIARAEEEEAKARLIKARAQLHEGMAKSFEMGVPTTREYLKGEIFGYNQDKD